MRKQVLITPARNAHDPKECLRLEDHEWEAIQKLSIRGGHALSTETVIPRLDAHLFAEAIRRGAAAGEPDQVPSREGDTQPNLQRFKERVDQLLKILDAGSVVIDYQTKY